MGASVGAGVDAAVGSAVGRGIGAAVGLIVGSTVGRGEVGDGVVGAGVGVGVSSAVGRGVGSEVGCGDGPAVGVSVEAPTSGAPAAALMRSTSVSLVGSMTEYAYGGHQLSEGTGGSGVGAMLGPTHLCGNQPVS